MIKPIPTLIHKPDTRPYVSYDDYKRLEKYCDQLQLEKQALANRVGQYSKLSEHDQEIELIKSS